MIDFPNSPVNGQTFVLGNTTYVYSSTSTAWTNAYLNSAVGNSYSIQGGGPGQILFQTGTNFTGFVSTGTAGQILVSAGAVATGPYWTSTATLTNLTLSGDLTVGGNTRFTGSVLAGTTSNLYVNAQGLSTLGGGYFNISPANSTYPFQFIVGGTNTVNTTVVMSMALGGSVTGGTLTQYSYLMQNGGSWNPPAGGLMNGGNATYLFGFDQQPTWNGPGTPFGIYLNRVFVNLGATSTGTVSNLYHVAVNGPSADAASSAAITNAYGFLQNNFGQSNNVTIANAYAYTGRQSATGATGTNWNLYMSGTAPNYLNGYLAIGTTNQTSGALLNVNGGVYVNGIMTVTNTIYSNGAAVWTTASLTNLNQLSNTTTGYLTSSTLGSFGVSAMQAGTGIQVSAATGLVTVTNIGVVSLVGTTYLGISAASGTSITLTNLGVQSFTAGSGISTSAATGTITVSSTDTLLSVTNRGAVTSNAINITNLTANTSGTTNTGALQVQGGVGVGGNLTVGGFLQEGLARVWTTASLTNLNQLTNGPGYLTSATLGTYGVSTITPGVGIQVSANTGSVTVTNVGVVSLVGSTYLGISAASGTSITLTNLGVQTLTAGTDTVVSASTGTITVWNTSTLQSVTNRGAVTSNAINITNLTANTSGTTNSGALLVQGGVGIGGNLTVGGFLQEGLARVWTTATLTNNNQLSNGSGYLTSATLGTYGVSAITAGTDTAVSTATGSILIWNTATLQSVTSRGATTPSAISITNTSGAISTSTGALQVTGGVGVGGGVFVGGTVTATLFVGNLTGAASQLGVTANTNAFEYILGVSATGSSQTATAATTTPVGFNALSGYVGFGTSSPTSPLYISQSSVASTLNQFAANTATVTLSGGNYAETSIVVGDSGSGFGRITHASRNASGSLFLPRIAFGDNVKNSGEYMSIQLAGATYGNTGTVLIGNGSILDNPLYGALLYVNGNTFINGTLTATNLLIGTNQVLTSANIGNFGVSAINAGTDTSINTTTGVVLIWNTSTFQSITNRGATTTNIVYHTNTTEATATGTAALVVSGGVGVGGGLMLGSASRGVNINTGTYIGANIVGAYTQSQLRITYPAIADWDHLVNSGGNYTISQAAGGGTLNLGAPTVVFGNAVGGNIVRFAGIAGGTTNINTDVQTGVMNIFTGMTTGQINLGGGTAGKLVVGFTTTAISTQSGALQVRGGVGISGDLYVNGFVNIGGALAWTTATLTNLGQLSNTTTNYLTSSTLGTYGVSSILAGADISVSGATGTVTISGTGTLQSITNRGAITSNAITISNVTQATSTSSAALMVGGGVGANSAYFNTLNVAQAATFAGPVTFSGTATYVLSTNTYWTDNILELHVPPAGVNALWTTDDLRDIGLRFHYYTNSADTNAALVLANDTKYLEWYNAGAEGTSTFAGSSYGTFKTGNIVLANTTASVSTATGSLIVAGGVGVGGNIYAGAVYDQNARVWTTATLTNNNQLSNGSGYLTSATLGSYGVSAISAGVGVTLSPATGIGLVTVTNVGVVSLIGTTYLGISAASGTSITLTNLGVQSLTAGADISVSASTGTITVSGTGTLQSITNRGAVTSNAISITNATANTSGTVASGALQVTGGAGIGANLSVAGFIVENGARVWTTATLTNLNQLNNGPGYLTSATIGNFGVSALFGTTYLGVSNSVGAVTLTNLGVQSFTAGSGISTSAATGTITVSSTDTLLSVTNRGAITANAIQITNATQGTTTSSGQALLVTGGVGIGGNVYAGSMYANGAAVWTTATLTNNNQLTNGSGYLTSATLGTYGVSALAAGLGISITPATGVGLVTVTNIGVISLANSPSIGVSAVNGSSISFTNLGVQNLSAGAGISVSASTGSVTVTSTATLQSVTNLGAVTNNAIQITNSTVATASTTGALVVTGGVGVGGDLRVAGTIYGTVSVSGIISTATNLAGGIATQIPYQTAPGVTGFIATPTVASTVLTWTGTNYAWVAGGTGSSTGTTSTFVINNTTAATSATNSGALQVTGGAGIAGALYVGGHIYDQGLQVLTSANLASFGVTTFSAGTTGLTPSSATAGAVTLAGTLAVTNGGTGITNLTTGYIPFGQGTAGFGGTANLFWDGPNNRLGIGTSSPSVTLDVAGATRIGGVNSQTVPASNSGYGTLFTSNYSNGGSETDIWNLFDNASQSFVFKQKTGATTFENVFRITSTATYTTGTITAGNISITGLTGYTYANAAGQVTASTTIPASAISGVITAASSLTNSVTFNNGGSGDASGTTYNGASARTISYNTLGAPSATGGGASGQWGIYTQGIRQSDGTAWLTQTNAIGASGARSTDLAPNTYNYGISSEFKNSSLYSATGTYSGLITYAPWLGTTASTGDPSYQLLFSPSSANATTVPVLKFRAGIDTTWGAWQTMLHSGNIASNAVTSFNTTLSGLTPSSAAQGAVTLAGTLGAASGGTGATTLTGYVYGNGTSAMTASTTIPASAISGTLPTANYTGNISATANTNAFEYIVGVAAAASTSSAATVATTVPVGFNASTGLLGVGTTSLVGRVTSAGVSYTPASWGTTAAFAGTGAYGGALSFINTGGSSDGFTFYLTGTPSVLNFGYGTNGGSASSVANLTSAGAFSAVTKSFVINHPTKAGMKLHHGSLEGPEHGVYVRGRLKEGNVIELPDYWTGLVDPDSITVNLTPIGKHQKLFVESVAIDKITVGNDNLLSKGVDCYYTVWAERKDVDKLIVEY